MTVSSAPNISLPAVNAAIHLFIPLHMPHSMRFRTRILRSADWHTVTMDTRFYMRYIKRIFDNRDYKKNSLLSTNCLVVQNNVFQPSFWVKGTAVSMTSSRIYCFDTSIAILDLSFSCESACLDKLADICSLLRHTDTILKQRVDPSDSSEDDKGKTSSAKYKKITINQIAKEILDPFGAYRLFDHLSDSGTTRADIFTTIIADETIENQDINIYRIAGGFDSRYHAEIPENTFFTPFYYLRWAITSKGACSLGLLTSDPANRCFIRDKWMDISDNRHMLWYLLVLHQKYAMYHYLNDIAEKGSMTVLRNYQKRIVLFNTRYRFEVVADDSTYQQPYQMARDAKLVESVFSDIDEEIERINDYHNVTADKNNVVAMTIVSLVCAISTFLDIFQWSAGNSSIYELMSSLTTGQSILLAIIMIAMAVAVAFLIIKPLFTRLFFWLKKQFYRLLEFFFIKK